MNNDERGFIFHPVLRTVVDTSLFGVRGMWSCGSRYEGRPLHEWFTSFSRPLPP